VRDINIIHVDKTYIRNGDVDAEALLSIVNVNDEVRVLCPNLERDIDDALAWVARETINENGCECRCKGSIPNHCAGFDHFNPDVPAQSIYLLPNIRSGRIKGFVDNECLALEDVQDDEVTLAMLPILQAAHAGIPVINRSRISEFLRALSFPLYFYDYETFKSAVPIMNGVSPHQQVPVQVSVHKLHIDGTLEHSEFLAKGPGYRRELLQSLRQSIGDVGHCVSWSKSFEIGRNKELAKDYPEYSEFLDSMNDRTVDLMEVFKRDYVDIRFKGSTSIKNVLPVVCPHLSYENMAVGNGGTAMAAWLSMSVETDPVLVEKKRKNLLEYCKLDTYAMVEIYRFLLGVI